LCAASEGGIGMLEGGVGGVVVYFFWWVCLGVSVFVFCSFPPLFCPPSPTFCLVTFAHSSCSLPLFLDVLGMLGYHLCVSRF